jgi:elongation factor P--(R)-beta-lysine ligase
MSNRRDEYLNEHWSRYPEMPQRALKWGRVEQHFIGTQPLGELILGSKQIGEAHFKATDVLVEGDLVALLPDKSAILLTPNLTGQRPKPELWSEHKKWQAFIEMVRQVFIRKSFTPVKTPTLVNCPGTEPSLDVFKTEFQIESKKRTFFLPTSPELNLKKLLAAGAERIFEIAPVFRNGEQTERHSPEFLMLEWYRAFSGLGKIKMDVIEMVEVLANEMQCPAPIGHRTYSVAELFKTFCNFDLTPRTTVDEFKRLAAELSVDVSAATSIDDYFYLIFMEKIENKWSHDELVFVEKYPPYQAALARLDQNGWAERFEVYWRGYELGNAFHELNDPTVQRARSQEDLLKKKTMGKETVGLDESFFDALDYGLPPSAGIAVGLERLYMSLTDTQQIDGINRIYKIWQNRP